MKNIQKGFSVVEIFIVIVILGLIGAISWFVYDRQNSKMGDEQADGTPVQTDTKKEETLEQTKITDETADWKEEENTEFGFSYKYPNENGWETSLIEASGELYELGERINNAGVNYTLCGNNCGFVFSFNVFAKDSSGDSRSNWGENQMEGNTYYNLTSKSNVTKNDVKGMRWEYTPSDSNTAKIIYYYFYNNNLSYVFTVNINGALADNVDLTKYGEKIMETFQFTN